LLLPLTDIDLLKKYVSSVKAHILLAEKYNTEIINSKFYTFASSALLRLFFTSNFKKMINIWLHLKFFSPPLAVLGWLRPWLLAKLFNTIYMSY